MARSFMHLSLEERRVIARMYGANRNHAAIARALRRDRSAIGRELRRNFWHDLEVPIAEGAIFGTRNPAGLVRQQLLVDATRSP